LNDEYVTGIHLDLMPRAERFAHGRTGSFDPIYADFPGRSTCHPEGRNPSAVRENDGRHGREEADAPLGSVTARPLPGAAAAAADPKVFETNREAPFEHFRIGQP
jgi:hypothetical protein